MSFMHHRRLVLLAFLLFATPALADTVHLRDGQKLKGKVTERADGRIEIETKGGSSRIVDRADVITIERDGGPSRAVDEKVDIVYLNDGRILSGNVTFSDDGKEIVIANDKGAETRIARELVKSIAFRHGKVAPPNTPGLTPTVAPVTSEDDAQKKWHAQLDGCLARLRDPLSDPKDRKKARDEIIELGVFAVNFVKEEIARVGSNDTVVRPVLEEVLQVAEFKQVVPAKVEDAIPGICEKLIDKDPKERIKAVNRIALDCPDDCPTLLLYLIQKDPDAKVKSICVGQLAILKRYDELAQVLKVHEHGELRFVAAVELGDAGIYIGIPVLIESLKLEGDSEGVKKVRLLAIEKLKAWTNQGNLGYLPESDDKTERDAAVARWESWWQAEGRAWAEKNSRIESAQVSDKDKQRALDLWRDANKVIAELQKKQDDAAKAGAKVAPTEVTYAYETAAFIFQQAYEVDPTFSSARLSRAIILYEQLGRPREAEGELKLLIQRFVPEKATYLRSLATTHLARLAELEHKWARAESYWREVRAMDPDNLDPYVGVGDSFLERALATPEPAPKQEGKPNPPTEEEKAESLRTREDYLAKAVTAFKDALDVVEKKQKALRDSVTDLGPASGEIEDYASARLLLRVREDRDSLIKRAAGIWFRLGRAESARPTGGKDALAAFKAARSLDPKDERYSKAAALWEKLAGSDKP